MEPIKPGRFGAYAAKLEARYELELDRAAEEKARAAEEEARTAEEEARTAELVSSLALNSSKVLMIAMSLTAGVCLLSVLKEQPSFLLGRALSLAGAFAYPIAGAVVVKLMAVLRSWAWGHEEPPQWSRTGRLFLGAVWPFTLVAATIIYIFLGIIDRIF
jgi:hypothetical protein